MKKTAPLRSLSLFALTAFASACDSGNSTPPPVLPQTLPAATQSAAIDSCPKQSPGSRADTEGFGQPGDAMISCSALLTSEGQSQCLELDRTFAQTDPQGDDHSDHFQSQAHAQPHSQFQDRNQGSYQTFIDLSSAESQNLGINIAIMLDQADPSSRDHSPFATIEISDTALGQSDSTGVHELGHFSRILNETAPDGSQKTIEVGCDIRTRSSDDHPRRN